MEITFSIVGTAGREDDANKLSKKHFEAMYITAEGLLEQFTENGYPVTHVVSGGSAWADHVAVKLFLDKKVSNLRLYIPVEFEAGSFVDSYKKQLPHLQDGSKKSSFSIAKTLNHYHQAFQYKSGINSLTEIEIAKHEGAELYLCRGGFHGRNAMVAKSDLILAMTFGKGCQVKDGGTADTMRKYLARVRKEGMFDKSFHFNLNTGTIFVGCTVPKEDEEEIKDKKFHKSLHMGVTPHTKIIGMNVMP